MTTRHFTRRAPKKRDTAWGRFPSPDGASVTYRLFRRDHNNCTQMETRMFFRDMPRAEMARSLWKARIQLRKFVDDLQLQYAREHAQRLAAELHQAKRTKPIWRK